MITKGSVNKVGCVGLVALAVAAAPRLAGAQTLTPQTCSQLVTASLPVGADAGAGMGELVIAGPDASLGSATGPALAAALAAILGPKVPIVYVTAPSCAAIQNIVASTPAGATGNFLASTGASAGMLTPCTASGMVPDVALSEVYADTCTPGLLTANQLDLQGPVNVSTLVVPFASTEFSINADAAYVIFGFGAVDYAVKPWTDPGSIFEPEIASSGLMLVGSAIGLAPSKWANPLVDNTALAAEVKAVSGGKANASIGILPAVTAEANPTSLKVLAYEHTGQSCGYLPDSDSLHTDRINAREGRYALWGPTHFIMSVDASGNPLDHNGQPNSSLAMLANLLASTGPASSPSAPPTALAPQTTVVTESTKQLLMLGEASAGLVPWCAMEVVRSVEAGDESSYSPLEPCGCAFENAMGSSPSPMRCATCQSDTDCQLVTGAPSCSYGYCEATP
jgi:hypothetical protein